jgi:hypothetical protein
MNRLSLVLLAGMAAFSFAVAATGGAALAQEKQRISYKVTAENSKYTQQNVLDVGDAPGHQVRVYEIHRTFPSNAPMINGVKLVETWTRATSDYTDGNGTGITYGVWGMENGDKVFTRQALVAQSTGTGKLTATTVGPITGGTGKFTGIRGVTRSVTTADPKAGFNETQTDIEYWIEK